MNREQTTLKKCSRYEILHHKVTKMLVVMSTLDTPWFWFSSSKSINQSIDQYTEKLDRPRTQKFFCELKRYLGKRQQPLELTNLFWIKRYASSFSICPSLSTLIVVNASTYIVNSLLFLEASDFLIFNVWKRKVGTFGERHGAMSR